MAARRRLDLFSGFVTLGVMACFKDGEVYAFFLLYRLKIECLNTLCGPSVLQASFDKNQILHPLPK
jgi:hypothetical protein